MSDTFKFATHPQARAVGDAERGFVFEARRCFEEPRHLLLAQHDRRFARLVHDPQRANEVGRSSVTVKRTAARRWRR